MVWFESESWSWSWSSKSCSRIWSCCSRIGSLCSHRSRMRGLCSHGSRRPGRWRWRRWTGQQWKSRVGSYTKYESRAHSPCPRRISLTVSAPNLTHRVRAESEAQRSPINPADRFGRLGDRCTRSDRSTASPGGNPRTSTRADLGRFERMSDGRLQRSKGPTVQRSTQMGGFRLSGKTRP